MEYNITPLNPVRWFFLGDEEKSKGLIPVGKKMLFLLHSFKENGSKTEVLNRTLLDGSKISADISVPGIDIVRIFTEVVPGIYEKEQQREERTTRTTTIVLALHMHEDDDVNKAGMNRNYKTDLFLLTPDFKVAMDNYPPSEEDKMSEKVTMHWNNVGYDWESYDWKWMYGTAQKFIGGWESPYKYSEVSVEELYALSDLRYIVEGYYDTFKPKPWHQYESELSSEYTRTSDLWDAYLYQYDDWIARGGSPDGSLFFAFFSALTAHGAETLSIPEVTINTSFNFVYDSLVYIDGLFDCCGLVVLKGRYTYWQQNSISKVGDEVRGGDYYNDAYTNNADAWNDAFPNTTEMQQEAYYLSTTLSEFSYSGGGVPWYDPKYISFMSQLEHTDNSYFYTVDKANDTPVVTQILLDGMTGTRYEYQQELEPVYIQREMYKFGGIYVFACSYYSKLTKSVYYVLSYMGKVFKSPAFPCVLSNAGGVYNYAHRFTQGNGEDFEDYYASGLFRCAVVEETETEYTEHE